MASRFAHKQALGARDASSALLMGLGGAAPPVASQSEYARANAAVAASSEAARALREPPAVARLRGKLAGKGPHGVHGLVRLMRVMDDDQDGVLTREELKYGLEDLGVKLNGVELDEVFEYFDRNRNGAISQDEFLRGVRGALSAARLQAVQQAFAQLEKQPGGGVLLEDMEEAYDAKQHPDVLRGKLSAGQCLREFLRQWEGGLASASMVSEDEFLEYHKNLSAAIESDAEFFQLVRGVWHLPLPEAVGRAASATATATATAGTGTGGAENSSSRLNAGAISTPSKAAKDSSRDIVFGNASGGAPADYTSSSAAMQRHPDVPLRAKARVPDWVKFDGQQLCFSLFFKQVGTSHQGTFDPHTRTFDTKAREHFHVRTVVLKYFLEDGTAMATETTPQEQRPVQFMSRGPLPCLLADLFVGNSVTLKGVEMVVSDADKRARSYFSDELGIKMGAALEVPASEEAPDLTAAALARQAQTLALGRAPAASLRPQQQARPSGTLTNSKFIENDGKILQFDCTWDDPSPLGDRRIFSLLFHLSDDCCELREVQTRNSGRERQALLNLRRQRLPNPERPDGAFYGPEDLLPGSTVTAFGRELKVLGCDGFTRRYLELAGLWQRGGAAGLGARTAAGAAPAEQAPSDLQLYSNAREQKCRQILAGIRATIEQKTRFGSEFEQTRMLHAYLKKFMRPLDAEDGRQVLARAGFRSAVSGFSCFGADVDLLFDCVRDQQQQQEQQDEQEELVWISAFVKAVYPSAPVDEASRAGSSSAYGVAAAHAAAPPAAPPQLNAKVKGLLDGLRSKIEVSTNFGDLAQQRQALRRALLLMSPDKAVLDKAQLGGALSKYNCWPADAALLFDAVDVDGKGRLAVEALVQAVLPGK